MQDEVKLNNQEEIKLEGKLKENISPAYQSRTGNDFYVARLIDDNSQEELPLFFWDDGRFDYETKLKIQELVAGDYIVVRAQKRINPRDGREIYHVLKFEDSPDKGDESEIF